MSCYKPGPSVVKNGVDDVAGWIPFVSSTFWHCAMGRGVRIVSTIIVMDHFQSLARHHCLKALAWSIAYRATEGPKSEVVVPYVWWRENC